MRNLIIGIALSVFASVAYAESPYTGQEIHEIKALSPYDIDGYLRGNGMGYAKAAELNHYPGPKHVLELAHQLELTHEQSNRTQELFNIMSKKAIGLGKQLVDKEQELDRLFANGSINSDTLKVLLSEIGALQVNLRYVHLHAHIGQKDLLTKHQVQSYDQHRGYGVGHGEEHNHSH